MSGTRAERDSDLIENHVRVTGFKTTQNQYKVFCGICNKVFYTDEQNFEYIKRATEQGLDNPFLCDDCREEYEDLAYSR